MEKIDWSKKHIVKVGSICDCTDGDIEKPEEDRKKIEPWLTAVFQSEHFSLLTGNGLTKAVSVAMGVESPKMDKISFACKDEDKVSGYAEELAKKTSRGNANIEDQIRAANALVEGLQVMGDAEGLGAWKKSLDTVLRGLIHSILQCEQDIAKSVISEDAKSIEGRRLLESFIMSFASRAASRERLHIFTTNYDRIIEFGCDLLGLHSLDRFVGVLNPVFRSSRLDIDIHYNPPGIRGEPRFLEGVVKLTKLHGSIDWCLKDDGSIVKYSIPFGSEYTHPDLPKEPTSQLIVYPNAAKDMETSEYPYAELFRDFSAALCRPNSALVTYGYSFGDDHINRVIRDMLTIPSTHLVIISYDDVGGRIHNFCKRIRDAQVTLLIGQHYGDLQKLVDYYLPKPAIDLITCRRADILERRGEKPVGRSEGHGEAN